MPPFLEIELGKRSGRRKPAAVKMCKMMRNPTTLMMIPVKYVIIHNHYDDLFLLIPSITE